MFGKHVFLSGVAIAVLALATGPAAAQISIGGDDPLVTIGSSGGVDADVDVNLGGSGDGLGLGGDGVDADVTANIGGGGNDPDVSVDLNGGGNDADVILDLFGPGTGTYATADINAGDDANANVTIGGGGNDVDAEVSLFGDGSGDGDADADVAIDIFGPGGDDTQTGSVGNNNTGGNGGAGGTGVTPSNGGQLGTARLTANAAGAAHARANCFSPDEDQIDHLLSRNSYSASITASWDSAASVSIVPVELCPEARARVAAIVSANANIGFMQAEAASSPAIRAAITPQYGPDDVLAIDTRGNELMVYVY